MNRFPGMRPLIVLLFLLAVPAKAAAAPTDLGFKTNRLDVAMTKDGAAHVARITTEGNTNHVVMCRIPAGATACTQTADLALPNTDDSVGPWVVTDGTRVIVAVGNHNGAEERTFASVSPDGNSFPALKKVAEITATDVELAPSGDHLWISSTYGKSRVGQAEDYLAFASVPLDGSSNAVVLNSTSGGRSIDGQILGITPQGTPLAFLDGNAPDLQPSGNFYRAFTGVPTDDAQLNDAAKWAAPTRYELADPFERNGSKDVTSANGRMWLAYEGLQRDTVLRQFVGTQFGPATSPDCTASRFGAGLQDAPDVAITRTGNLLVTEVGGDGDNLHLGFFLGTPDGTKFSPYTELAVGPSIRDVETAADPTSDFGGIAVYTTDDIYADKGEVFFTRLPTVAPANCPDPKAAPKATSSSIGGSSVTLSVPGTCATAGTPFTVKVTFKKKKKLKAVTKVVFSATGNKNKTDKKKPFSAKFTVPVGSPSGTVISVKAKVTVKLKGKKAKVTKTVKGSFVAC